MKKIIFKTIFYLPFLAFVSQLCADAVISLYLKQYPLLKDVTSSQTFVNQLRQPSKIAKHIFRFVSEKSIPVGLFATYGGNMTVSDLTGHIVFPYKHSKPLVTILITDRITPTVMFFNTLENWKLEQGTPAQMFKMERKQDAQTKQYYWDTQETDLPEDFIIPIETIIILAKPKHIYVPTGITLTTESPHLLLPDIFVRKGINKLDSALYILNLLQFFGAITDLYKIDKTFYIELNTR